MDTCEKIVNALLEAEEENEFFAADFIQPALKYRDLDEFTRSYIDTALWSSTDESTPSGGEPLDKNYVPEDIDQKTLQKMALDCKNFQRENPATVSDLPEAGACFWLSRSGAGSGFFDADEWDDETRSFLQDAAKGYGEFYLYVGDLNEDGERKIYGY